MKNENVNFRFTKIKIRIDFVKFEQNFPMEKCIISKKRQDTEEKYMVNCKNPNLENATEISPEYTAYKLAISQKKKKQTKLRE